MRKAAIFDIDDTLVDGSLGIDFVNYMAGKGFFDIQLAEYIDRIYRQLKSGEMGYQEAIPEISRAYGRGLKGKRLLDLIRYVDGFIITVEYLPGSKELVKLMNEKGFITMAISGSPPIIMRRLDLGFNYVYGTVGCLDPDGTYTGEIIEYASDKTAEVERFANDFDVDLAGSYGFGDSGNDDFLSIVGHPAVINPGPLLRKTADEMDWPVFETPQKAYEILSGKL